MRAQLEIRKQEEALDERILELSKQLAWFQREAVLQEQENKRLKQALKNAKISKELVEEDKRFYQRQAIESKRQELVARKTIVGIVQKDAKSEESAGNYVLKKEGLVHEPQNKIEEVIWALFKKHEVDLTENLAKEICSYISIFERMATQS